MGKREFLLDNSILFILCTNKLHRIFELGLTVNTICMLPNCKQKSNLFQFSVIEYIGIVELFK